jgi:acetylornithine/N-succinyldiaminopimelate aminotransferase
MSQTAATLAHAREVLMSNYARLPVVLTRGEREFVYDSDNRKYLDMFAGFGGSVLGHCHPDLVRAVNEQANQLWAVGNQFYSEPQIHVADHLNRTAFKGQAFFCHSGLESNEAAVKLARLRGAQASPKKWKVITFNRSFHGRSLAMIAATGNPKTKEGFEPAVPGFINIDADFDLLAKTVDAETCAILVEPIQGEGGINFFPPGFHMQLRKLCNEKGITLISDEVWTGCGRTGKWFGYQHFYENGATPDIVTMGKAVGGGLPVGIMFAVPEVAKLFVPGKHGCTLGANPICMAVSNAVFNVIQRDKLHEHATVLGEHAMARLKNEKSIASKIASIRGKGLFLGIELKSDGGKIVEKALEKGLILNLAAQKVVRLAPSLAISKENFDHGLDLVVQTIAEL